MHAAPPSNAALLRGKEPCHGANLAERTTARATEWGTETRRFPLLPECRETFR